VVSSAPEIVITRCAAIFVAASMLWLADDAFVNETSAGTSVLVGVTAHTPGGRIVHEHLVVAISKLS
jgi:hypothetical protein